MSQQDLPIRDSRNPNTAPPLERAEELERLLQSVQAEIIPFVAAADADAATLPTGHGLQQSGGGPRAVLGEQHAPLKLRQLLDMPFPPEAHSHSHSHSHNDKSTARTDDDDGHGGATSSGEAALRTATARLLQYSVNTWTQGFLDKLYAAPRAPGVAAELVLAALNTNVHVYGVAPALTVVEKDVGAALAARFGLRGPRAGGVSQPGGSAANAMSLAVARAVLFPETRERGNDGRRFVVFTSEHGHYSVEKAAVGLGLGSRAVRSVPVDAEGRMKADELERLVREAKDAGEVPFYVNATAGTTVLGSFDPFEEIAAVCKKHNLWFHIDGSWGGSVVFSEKQRHKLAGAEKADSIAICAHKMLNVPLTCSFLLGKDLKEFHQAMTLPAGYLFHDDPDAAGGDDVWNLADLTPQCGRRGDSLKLAFTWIYYGTEGLGAYVDHGFEIAAHLTSLVKSNPRFTLVSQDPPPCLQICFYVDKATGSGNKEQNDRRTEQIVKRLVPRGFMTDYAPGDDGKFFRVVVNGQTRKETVEGLLKAIEEVADRIDNA